ncbi:MAG: FHA domain-containing protein [Planctomycetaceae bacterium]
MSVRPVTTEGDVRVSGQLTSGDAVAWIGVASPSSPHRLETMLAGTFQIGRGKACHLRLGDESIPELLAVIVADRISARISCQCSSPLLLLNGVPVEDSPLSDGDLLEAGPYTLVFRRLLNGAESAVPDDGQGAINASEATALDLVDALDEEIAVVEELEHTPTRGWQELATRLRQTDSADAEPRDVIPIDDVQALLQKLEQGQQVLRRQHEVMLQELAELKQQNSWLAESLLHPSDSVVPIRPAGSRPQRRASA